MNWIESLISPMTITFFVIVVGYFVGKIRIKGLSLNLAGILIVAIVTGYVSQIVDINISEMQTQFKTLSSLGTALFVSVIGVSTGYAINVKNLKDLKALLIGSTMVLSSFAILKLLLWTDKTIDESELIGAFCGALTTTPGLSTACESYVFDSSRVVVGYGYTYIFGVVLTVLGVQTVKNFEYVTTTRTKTVKSVLETNNFYGVLQIGVSVLLGYLIGNIKLPTLQFSFGSSGGMLCAGIVVGFCVKKWIHSKMSSNNSLSLLRNLGLSMFFVGTGVPAGMQVVGGLNIRIILYGIIMTIIPILIGYIVDKVLFEKNSLLTASVIAGGMTSTPAIGVLIKDHQELPLCRYSITYVSALITIIVLLRIF